MKENKFLFSTEEILLAMNYVSYVIYNATKDKPEDEYGIFVNVQEFTKYIPYGDIPTLVSILQKTSIFTGLDIKVLDWTLEQ